MCRSADASSIRKGDRSPVRPSMPSSCARLVAGRTTMPCSPSGAIDYAQAASRYDGPGWLGQQGNWTTDEDGRFEIRGVGRDRIIGLEVRSPGMAKTVLYAMARTSREPAKPLARPTRPLPAKRVMASLPLWSARPSRSSSPRPSRSRASSGRRRRAGRWPVFRSRARRARPGPRSGL